MFVRVVHSQTNKCIGKVFNKDSYLTRTPSGRWWGQEGWRWSVRAFKRKIRLKRVEIEGEVRGVGACGVGKREKSIVGVREGGAGKK